MVMNSESLEGCASAGFSHVTSLYHGPLEFAPQFACECRHESLPFIGHRDRKQVVDEFELS
jgi:hypothetical protein